MKSVCDAAQKGKTAGQKEVIEVWRLMRYSLLGPQRFYSSGSQLQRKARSCLTKGTAGPYQTKQGSLTLTLQTQLAGRNDKLSYKDQGHCPQLLSN